MPRQSKRVNKAGCGTLSITNTPGESYSIDSKEVLKQIEDLKKAITKSRLKYDNYNLIVNKPRDINKGYSKPLYRDEPRPKIKQIEPKPERKKNEKLKKIPAVKSIINKYDNKEALTEKEYDDLVIYKNIMKKNARVKKIIEKIDEIINVKYPKKEEKKEEHPTKEEIETEIELNKLAHPEDIVKIKKHPKERKLEYESYLEILPKVPPEIPPEMKREEQPPKRKRGRPRKTDKKGSGVKNNKEVLDEFRRLYKQDQDLAGDGLLSSIYANSLGYWFKYGIDWHKQKKAQQEEIERLKKELEGSGIGENVRDFFLGPIGWIRWAKRAQRDREIEDLKRQIEEKKKKQIQK